MESSRFDRLTKELAGARSRRALLSGAVAAALSAVPGIALAGSKRASGEICRKSSDCLSNQCSQPDKTGRKRCLCTTPAECPQPKASECSTATCLAGVCGIAPANVGQPCDSSNKCITGATCTNQGICAGTPKNCDDGNLCTTDTCDPQTGKCVHRAKDCNDNNACTRDFCDVSTGQCINTPISCTDGNPCTVDTCDPVRGCVNTPKYDLAQLDLDDKCNTHSCNSQTGELVQTPVNCDDNNACTVDTCDSALGCIHTPIVCNDNNPCTTDSCVDGNCVYTPITGIQAAELGIASACLE